jgi:ankyrin repeat protein
MRRGRIPSSPLRGRYRIGGDCAIPRKPVAASPPGKTFFDGRLSLHCAVSGDSLETLEFLAQESPQALQEGDNDGLLPLHYSARLITVDVARVLSREWPRGLQVRSNDGRPPMHVAAAASESLEVLEFFFRARGRPPFAKRIATASSRCTLSPGGAEPAALIFFGSWRTSGRARSSGGQPTKGFYPVT